MNAEQRNVTQAVTHRGAVHCPMCTHNVEAEIVQVGRQMFVKPGQKCSRCSGALDAAYVLRWDKAA
jgi:hypothetical protein